MICHSEGGAFFATTEESITIVLVGTQLITGRRLE